jgi:hypothetical protein
MPVDQGLNTGRNFDEQKVPTYFSVELNNVNNPAYITAFIV